MKISEIRKKLGLMSNKKYNVVRKIKAILDAPKYKRKPFITDTLHVRQTGRTTEIILKVLREMSESNYVVYCAEKISMAHWQSRTIFDYAQQLGIDKKYLLKVISKDQANNSGISKSSVKIIYDHNLP